MYSLIEFPNEGRQKPEVEVVPHIWLERKEKIWSCYWPLTTTTKEIRKAIEKCYQPEKNWIKYNCRVLRTYASYDEARKKLVDAEFTSTLETDIELTEHQRPKRKLKRPNRFASSSSNSSEEKEVLDNMPPLPKLRTPTKQNIFTCNTITPYKLSISSAITSPKHSISSTNSFEKSSSITMNSSRSATNISMKYKRPSQRIMNTPTCLSPNCSSSRHSPSVSIKCRRLSPKTINFSTYSPPRSSSPRHSSNVSIMHKRSSSSPTCLCPRRLSSTSSPSLSITRERLSSKTAITSPKCSSSKRSPSRRSSLRGSPSILFTRKKSLSRTITSPTYSSPKRSTPRRLSPRGSPNILITRKRSLSRTISSSTCSSPKRSSSRQSSLRHSPRNIVVASKRGSLTEINSPQCSHRSASNTVKVNKSDFFGIVITKLMELENSINLLLPMVKQLVAHFRLSKPYNENVPKMPVDTDENLEEVERFLATDTNFEYMINNLSISGGTTISQISRRTLERIITNNYAKNFNWAGRAPKRAFKVLKIKDLVIATVKTVEPNAAINQIENSIKDWLKLASLRVTIAEAKTLKTNLTKDLQN